MNPQQLQDTNMQIGGQPQMQGNPQIDKANEAAASLAFATHLQSQLMEHQNPLQEQEQPQEMPEEQPIDIKAELDALKQEFEKKLEDMRKGITEEIKTDIAVALKEEDAEEN